MRQSGGWVWTGMLISRSDMTSPTWGAPSLGEEEDEGEGEREARSDERGADGLARARR